MNSSSAIVVYDVFGREVRRLDRGGNTGGGTRVEWDGRDAHGKEAASGVYWYVLATRDGLLKGKIVKH